MSDLTVKPISSQKEVLSYLSESGWFKNTTDTKDNFLYSVLSFQESTNNFSIHKGLGLYNKSNKLVGVLLLLAHHVTYKNENHICIQGCSAFINKEYRGNFKLFIKKLYELYPNELKLFMFSSPKVHNTVKKFKYEVVNTSDFTINYYYINNYLSFFFESFGFKRLKKPRSATLTRSKSIFCNHFEYSYDLLEVESKKVSENKVCFDWSNLLLKKKYQKNLANHELEGFKDNLYFQFVCLDKNESVLGMCIIKKIAGFNRFYLVELKSLNDEVTIDLYTKVKSFVKRRKIDALLINSFFINQIPKTISKQWKVKKKSDLYAFIYKNKELKNVHVQLEFSDDDTFF